MWNALVSWGWCRGERLIGGSPAGLVALHLTLAEPPLAGSQHSSRLGNYCLTDPEIQGQLCFNKRENLPPLLQLCLDHKKEPCASEELAGRKLNITPTGNGSAIEEGWGWRVGAEVDKGSQSVVVWTRH